MSSTSRSLEWWLVAILTLVIGTGVGCERKTDKKTLPSLKIGVILPLTGDASAYGTSAKAGMDLAFDELRKAGGMAARQIQAIYEDSKADPKTAVTSFQKLVDLDKVPVVLGPMTSSEALAVAPVAERRRVVMLTPTASTPALTGAGDYIFRDLTSDVYDGIAMAQYAYDSLKLQTAAICYTNNDFGLGLKETFEKEFNRLGGFVANIEALAVGATDFRSQIQKVKQTAPEAIFLVGGKEMGRFLKQTKELDLKAQILSIAVFEDPEIISVAGSAANNAYYTYRTFDPSVREGPVESFVSKFSAKYGKEPDIYAALSYDAVYLLAEAIKSHGATSDEIKAGLYAIRNFPGVTGATTFDSNGDVVKPIGIKMVKNGEFIWVEQP